MEDLEPGRELEGPCIIVQAISTIVLEIGCKAVITADGDLDVSIESTLVSRHDDEADEHRRLAARPADHE